MRVINDSNQQKKTWKETKNAAVASKGRSESALKGQSGNGGCGEATTVLRLLLAPRSGAWTADRSVTHAHLQVRAPVLSFQGGVQEVRSPPQPGRPALLLWSLKHLRAAAASLPAPPAGTRVLNFSVFDAAFLARSFLVLFLSIDVWVWSKRRRYVDYSSVSQVCPKELGPKLGRNCHFCKSLPPTINYS